MDVGRPIGGQARDLRVRIRARTERSLLDGRSRWFVRAAALLIAIGGPAAIATVRDIGFQSPGFAGTTLLYLLPVIAATLLAGFAGSLCAVAAGTFIMLYAHGAPKRHLHVPTNQELFPLALFVLVGLVLARSLGRERAGSDQLKGARERLAYIARVAELLSGASLDFRRTLSELARISVPHLADLCVVDVLDEDGRITTVVVAHDEPVDPLRADSLLAQPSPSPDAAAGVAAVIRTGTPEIYPRVDEADLERIASNPMQLNLLRGHAIRSLVIVPVRSPQRVFGAVTLAITRQRTHYSAAELILAEDVAARAGTALENVLLYEQRTLEARTLQQSLLPAQIPAIPGTEVVVRFRPQGRAHLVGGDFYDVFQIDERTWGFAVGDVCGKGVEAAALTGLARHTIRIGALRERAPSRVLEVLNQALLHQGSDRYCTAVYGRLEMLRDGCAQLDVAAGGHPLPVLRREGGRAHLIGVPGTLLGVFGDPEVTDATVFLEPGDSVVLYTDGLLDERNPTPEDRLLRLVDGRPGGDAETLARVIEDDLMMREPTPDDDVALVVLRMAGRRTVRLPIEAPPMRVEEPGGQLRT